MKGIGVICATVVVVMSYSFVSLVDGQIRFLAQIHKINQEVDQWYRKETNFSRLKENFGQTTGEVKSDTINWPKLMLKVLQLALGEPISNRMALLKVNRIVAGLRSKNPDKEDEFLKNLTKFLATKFRYGTDDFRKVECLRQMNESCLPYRQGKNKMYFDFYGAINDLIKYKKMEEVDNIEFSRKVVESFEPIGPLYSATIICQYVDKIMSTASDNTKEFNLELPADGVHEIDEWYYPIYSRRS